MTYEEKLVWLDRYREADKKYQRLSWQLAEAQAAARKTTQNISAAPGGGGDGQSLARAVEREEEAERRCYEQLAVCDRLFAEIDAVLSQLASNRAYCILRQHYLNCLTWEKIAEAADLSTRRVYAIRREAVNQLEI